MLLVAAKTGGVLELVGNWGNKELVDDKLGWKRRLFRTCWTGSVGGAGDWENEVDEGCG